MWASGGQASARHCRSSPSSLSAAILLTVSREIAIQMLAKLVATFQPDNRKADRAVIVETGLFMGVRDELELAATQLRWQVRLHPDHIVQVEGGNSYLETLGGSLFITSKDG